MTLQIILLIFHLICYSILDDCIFKAYNFFTDDRRKLTIGHLYADVYSSEFGKKFMANLNKLGIYKKTITKSEIIEGVPGVYLSDWEFGDLKETTSVDYKDESQLEKYLIKTKVEYEQKLNRPIMCPDEINVSYHQKELIKQ